MLEFLLSRGINLIPTHSKFWKIFNWKESFENQIVVKKSFENLSNDKSWISSIANLLFCD